MNATMTKMTKGFSQAKADRFIAREIASMGKLRSKGHRDFKSLTDAQIVDAATRLARFYSVGETYSPAKP